MLVLIYSLLNKSHDKNITTITDRVDSWRCMHQASSSQTTRFPSSSCRYHSTSFFHCKIQVVGIIQNHSSTFSATLQYESVSLSSRLLWRGKYTSIMNKSLSPNRKVHFVLHCRGSYIEPSNHKIDPTNIWYSKAEYSQMDNNKRAILCMMQTCKLLDDEEVCTQDLEARTHRGSRRKQWITNKPSKLWSDDPEMMAEVYKGSFSIPCIKQSHNLSSRDAQATKAVFHAKQDYLFLFDKESCKKWINAQKETRCTVLASYGWQKSKICLVLFQGNSPLRQIVLLQPSYSWSSFIIMFEYYNHRRRGRRNEILYVPVWSWHVPTASLSDY
jgi:hypothetical protein